LPHYPSKWHAFTHLMKLPIKRQQEGMFNGIMFFIPLSTFIVTKLEIIGNKLDLTYADSLNSQIRVKIY
jgi:hypothetical protein